MLPRMALLLLPLLALGHRLPVSWCGNLLAVGVTKTALPFGVENKRIILDTAYWGRLGLEALLALPSSGACRAMESAALNTGLRRGWTWEHILTGDLAAAAHSIQRMMDSRDARYMDHSLAMAIALDTGDSAIMNRELMLDNWRMLVGLGELAGNHNRSDISARYFRKAVSLSPGSVIPVVRLAEVLIQQHDYAEALQALYDTQGSFRGETQLKKLLVRAAVGQADTLTAQSEYSQAVEVLSKALASSPENLELRTGLARAAASQGEALIRAGRLSEAIEGVSQALHFSPDSSELKIVLAHVWVGMGEYQRAIDLLAPTLAASPSTTGFVILGAAQFELGRLTASIESSRQALGLDPRNLWAMYWLGRALYAEGSREEAAAWWQRALKLDPAFVPAIDALSMN